MNKAREQRPTLLGFEVLTMATTHTGMLRNAIYDFNLKTSAEYFSESKVTIYLLKRVTHLRKRNF
jgi:hypothetical protein